jgi:hypothetical protein
VVRGGTTGKVPTFLLTALSAVLFGFGCGKDPTNQKGFEELARSIRSLAVPAVSGIDTSGVERTGVSAQISWEFGIQTSWESYARWAADRLKTQGGFQLAKEAVGSLTFSKQLSGDFHRIEIDEVRPRRIRLTLLAYAS